MAAVSTRALITGGRLAWRAQALHDLVEQGVELLDLFMAHQALDLGIGLGGMRRDLGHDGVAGRR